MNSPGRVCPVHYRYQPAVLARARELHADTLVIAGGLYGNLAALDALHRFLEPQAQLVFNGDFNWFNIDADSFATINSRVLQHAATRGNIETELSASSTGVAGCGCAYTEDVDDGEVARSNAIMMQLCQVGTQFPDLTERLAALPMHLVAQVGELRIGIVHGDAGSLAGWKFAHDYLHAANERELVRELFNHAGVDIFASSHTCLPGLRTIRYANKQFVVINNGASGMPNFAGTHFGVVTRISTRPRPRSIHLYGTRIGDVFVDAIKLHYDHDLFVDQFLSKWPVTSPAHQSYYSRIIRGPDFSLQMALGAAPEHRIRQCA